MRDPITKADLTIGTRVILRGDSLARARQHLGGTSDVFTIHDLYQRATYQRADFVAVKRPGVGLALGVAVADIAEVIA